MVKVSSITKVRIILSIVLWAAGAVVLLGGTALTLKTENAMAIIFITAAIVLAGILTSIKKDQLSKLKPQLVRKS